MNMKRYLALPLIMALAAGLLGAAAPAQATSSVPNPSFEDGWSARKLKCWNLAGPGPGKLTVTRNGHWGRAAYAYAGGPAGTRSELITDHTPDCRISVVAGRAYVLSYWLSAAGSARAVVDTYSPKSGWAPWFKGSALPAGSLRKHSVELPPMPADVTAASVGVAFGGQQTVVLDDVALGRPAGQQLFRPVFPMTDQLITNEFAYWSPTNPSRSDSPDWEMTSGSLFAHDGNGYTGPINNVAADALSQSGTNSAIFRLTTRDQSFTDFTVRMNLDVEKLTSTPGTPKKPWDGVHLFLRHKSQFELYYASVARRDGKVLIKKKCRGGPSNGGTYYPLSREVSGQSIPFGTWLRVAASVRDNSDGSVTIRVSRDGRTVVSATDRGVGCAPITGPGATGVRGDNAQFEFRSFVVAALD